MTPFMGFILAREGSKRLPGKNILPFHQGKDIVQIAVQRCIEIGIPAILSTDIPKHLQPGSSEISVVHRPEHLRGDDVDPVDVVMDVLLSLKELPEYIILMQPTSTTWESENLVWAMRMVKKNGASGMFSVNPAHKPNGCFYIARTTDFIEQRTFFVENAWAYVMSWAESVDIDHLWDFRVAQAVISGRVTGK